MDDQLIQQISNAIYNQDGGQLGELLQLSKQAHRMQLMASPATSRNRVHHALRAPFNQIVSLHCDAFLQMHQDRPVDAFNSQAKCADALYEFIIKDKDTNWWLPAVDAVVLQLRVTSYRADDFLEKKGQKTKHKVDAQDILKKFFQRMIIDRSAIESSKKMGCLFIIIHLFKIYFKINNLRLCNYLIASVNNNSFPSFESFPRAQTVTYKYYLGRLQVFEEHYKEAEESLEYAFVHCDKNNTKNKRRILQFLVPVKLLRGKYPEDALLHKYQLHQFSGLVAATRKGDLQQFNLSLEQNQDFFINKGIFLILEKLRSLAYRNLFRAVFLHCMATKAKNQNQLELPLLQAALRINKIEMSTDELECILANLIFQGFIKGYIAHKRCVVVSKADPFPTPSSVNHS